MDGEGPIISDNGWRQLDPRKIDLDREVGWIVTAILSMAWLVVLGVVTYGVWWGIDNALGRSLLAQILSVGSALVAGSAAYAAIVLALRIPEARQIVDLFASRLRRRS